jgi:excinuclease ABC subunit A
MGAESMAAGSEGPCRRTPLHSPFVGTDTLVIHGAREHNLRNITLELPRDALIVFTGLSGSGKSSLAFDTIYAEGQRRYVESLSAYARQFLGQMEKPDVDFIEGLSPAISIDQKSTSRNPRSTVGTITEVYDYLRVLFARVGRPHCPTCGRSIGRQTPEQIVDQILELPEGTRFQVLAPVVRGRKGEYGQLLQDLARKGFPRARIDGEVRDLAEPIRLAKTYKHSIEVVVDRLVAKPDIRRRVADSIETALELAEGIASIAVVTHEGHEEIQTFSQNLACTHCHISFEELNPRNFSFNSPYGACTTCDGLGTRLEVDPELVVPDPDLSVADGALAPWASSTLEYWYRVLDAVAQAHAVDLATPWKKLPKAAREVLLFGSDESIYVTYKNRYGRQRAYWTTFEGAIPNIERRHAETDSDAARDKLEQFMREIPCRVCKGARLRPETLAVTIADRNISDVTGLSIRDTLAFVDDMQLTEREQMIAERLVKEIRSRLGFLMDVGLDYLTLGRASGTLAGGEAQRIRLATQIGSGLVGVLYILDEPSIGLHQRDNKRLIDTLVRLRDLGNTLIVVEHDEATILEADHIVDIGPAAGEHGGEVVYSGDLKGLLECDGSMTGAYLSGRRMIPLPATRRRRDGSRKLRLEGVREHNLKNINVDIPLGLFVCVTGVSGSGKSTLVQDVLLRVLMQKVYRSRLLPGRHKKLIGWEQVDKVIDIDQSPIGRTPRSNPATYTGVFDHVRKLFAQVPEARVRGFQPGRFSFNVRGGRCENCAGDGQIKIEMHFLPDVYVTCEICKGKRYNRETLEVKYKGRTISEVLEMSVDEALGFFQNIPVIKRHMQTLSDVGLGYIKLGQPAPTLSGGEAQRIKLASELHKRATGNTVYVLDEPTTGLHFEDIRKLLHVLQRLVDAGNTVLVIEHNLDVIKTADWIIDLGPEGGHGGGAVVATGTPEQIAANPASHTGRFLGEVLGVLPVEALPVG